MVDKSLKDCIIYTGVNMKKRIFRMQLIVGVKMLLNPVTKYYAENEEDLKQELQKFKYEKAEATEAGDPCKCT